MKNMSIGTFLIALVLIIPVAILISYVIKWFSPNIKSDSTSMQKYMDFLLRKASWNFSGTVAILAGLGVAFLLFNTRCSLPFNLNVFGLSDSQVFWIITGIVAVVAMTIQYFVKRSKY